MPGDLPLGILNGYSQGYDQSLEQMANMAVGRTLQAISQQQQPPMGGMPPQMPPPSMGGGNQNPIGSPPVGVPQQGPIPQPSPVQSMGGPPSGPQPTPQGVGGQIASNPAASFGGPPNFANRFPQVSPGPQPGIGAFAGQASAPPMTQPPAPPPQQQQPPQPMGYGQQPQGQLDWRQIIQQVTRANPGIPPQVLAGAVNKFIPLMNSQSQMEWKQVQMQLAGLRTDQGQQRIDQGQQRIGLQAQEAGLAPPGGGGGGAGPNAILGEGGERVAQAIANYQQPLPSLTRNNPFNRALIDRVYQINPQYNAQNYTGGQAFQRAAGNQGARVENAVNELKQLIPQAIQSSNQYSRTDVLALNELYNKWKEGVSDPRYNDFLLASFGTISAYIRAMNPTGQPRVADRLETEAIKLLSTAVGKEGYMAQLNRMWKEAQASQTATYETSKEGRRPGDINAPMPGAQQQQGPKPGTVTDGYRFKGGDPSDKANWEKASGG